MKISRLILLQSAALAFFVSNSFITAKPLNIFFGTGSRGSEECFERKKRIHLYQATFNPDNGKFSPSKLAANIGSPGFLTLHPNGRVLYAVGRWDEGSGAVGYHIKGGELKEFTRMVCPDGGGCHIAVHPSGKFLLTAQYGGDRSLCFPLILMVSLVNPQ